MNLNEIKSKKWKIDKNLIEESFYVSFIPREEQECHINIDRQYQIANVDCTFQTYILQFSKSEFFTLQSVIYSDQNKQKFVLGIKGLLDIKGISIRKNRRVLTQKQIQELRERAKVNLSKKK